MLLLLPKKYPHPLFLLLLTVFQSQIMLGQDNYEAVAKLNLEVKNMEAPKGSIYIAIYNSSKGFRDVDAAYQLRVVDVNSMNVRTSFSDLPSGEYAVTLFQDLNGNGKIDSNMMGIPTEPYGFSNNPRIYFGPPSFEATKVKLNRGETLDLQIRLR